ncbi:MAG: hypothetical protein ACKV0T_17010 [Planctomycetales bacterium]
MRTFVCLLTIGVVALFTGVSTSQWLYAGHLCCVRCGCEPCEKVCRLVREEKKITVTCLGYKDEEICVGGRSERGAKNCEMVCDENCDPEKLCSQPKRRVWFDWEPKNPPTIYTKRKLMRKTITKKVPSFKWVVEDLCEQCRQKAETEPVAESKSAKDDDQAPPQSKDQKSNKPAKPGKVKGSAKDEKERNDDY